MQVHVDARKGITRLPAGGGVALRDLTSPGSATTWAHRHVMTGTQVERGRDPTTATRKEAGLLLPSLCTLEKPT